MRRNYWVVVASALVLGVMLSGCSDTLVAPKAAPASAPTAVRFAPEGSPSLSLSGGHHANRVTEFTVGPNGGVFFVGNHAVVFPANSICDPSSGYGPDSWDAPCTTISAPLRISARLSNSKGASAVDFSPDLRFAPSASPSRWVWIFMSSPAAHGASDLSRFNIMFAESLGATPQNDAAEDPTLRTYVNRAAGVSFRRIKHFSGYMVNAGNSCDALAESCP